MSELIQLQCDVAKLIEERLGVDDISAHGISYSGVTGTVVEVIYKAVEFAYNTIRSDDEC